MAVTPAFAAQALEAPPLVQVVYQGRLIEASQPATGTRSFTFSLLDPAGLELWDSGSQALMVDAGLYGIVLGGPGMPPIPANASLRAGIRLHVVIEGVAMAPDVDIIPSFQARSAWELIGPFRGDLAGTQQQTLVMNLQGLPLDLTTTPPMSGQALVFNGTKWLASALQAAVGSTGPAGATGLTGPAGPAGAPGPIGAAGGQGPAGLPGTAGLAGVNGLSILNGAGAPSSTSAAGVPGDFYLDTTNNLIFGPKTGTSWASLVGVPMTGGPGSTGPAGPQGLVGPSGAAGAMGGIGLTGAAGTQGSIGLTGAAGATGGIGPTGAAGATGGIGLTGAVGATGGIGPTGAAGATGGIGLTGATGPTGPQGPAAALSYGFFYALMPGDNSATIAAGAAVLFPQSGPASGMAVNPGTGQITLAAIGIYDVSWQASVDEAGQLVLGLDNTSGATELAQTVAGRATGTSQISNRVLISTSAANAVLTVRNPAGNGTVLTMTTTAGGARSVSASVVILQIR
jgi:hypothetical protein